MRMSERREKQRAALAEDTAKRERIELRAGPPTYPAPDKTVKEARAEIAQAAARFLQAAEEWWLMGASSGTGAFLGRRTCQRISRCRSAWTCQRSTWRSHADSLSSPLVAKDSGHGRRKMMSSRRTSLQRSSGGAAGRKKRSS